MEGEGYGILQPPTLHSGQMVSDLGAIYNIIATLICGDVRRFTLKKCENDYSEELQSYAMSLSSEGLSENGLSGPWFNDLRENNVNSLWLIFFLVD